MAATCRLLESLSARTRTYGPARPRRAGGLGFPRRPVDVRMTPGERVNAMLAAAHRRALRPRHERLRDRRARAARVVYWAKVSGKSARSPAVVRAGGTVARCGTLLRCVGREIEDCARAWQDATEIVAAGGDLVDLLACPHPRVRIAAFTAAKHAPPPHRRCNRRAVPRRPRAVGLNHEREGDFKSPGAQAKRPRQRGLCPGLSA